MTSLKSTVAVLVGLLLASHCLVTSEVISEEARIQQWRERGNTWPPTWQLEGKDYRAVMQKREDEIMSLTGADERWGNFVQFTQGRMLPGFTRLGFEVVDTPPELQAKITRALAASFSNPSLMYDEDSYPSSYNKFPIKVAPAADVQEELLSHLQGRLEEWAGMKLEPTGSYGIRINREGSSQAMHYEPVRASSSHFLLSLYNGSLANVVFRPTLLYSLPGRHPCDLCAATRGQLVQLPGGALEHRHRGPQRRGAQRGPAARTGGSLLIVVADCDELVRNGCSI